MNKKREQQYRELGLTIAYYRKLRGLTQIQLAEAVDLSRTPFISAFTIQNLPSLWAVFLVFQCFSPRCKRCTY